jgi:serine phosphatase RsbU (regulator of sigma subunit)/ligand-binding sensor domain-containing protein
MQSVLRLSFLLGILFIFFLVFPASVVCKEEGLYHIRNYSDKEYETPTQIWSITQDKKGLLYFAYNTGIFQYDGVTWENWGKSVFNSMALDSSSGLIFTGLQDDIGYIEINAEGKQKFHSLKHKLNANERSLGYVYFTFVSSDAVYFISKTKVLRLRNGKFRVWQSEGDFHTAFQFGNHIYVRQKGIGLVEVGNEELIPIKGGELLQDSRLDFLIADGPSNLYGGSQDLGLLKFTLPGGERNIKRDGLGREIIIEKVKSDVSELLIRYKVFKAIRLSNGKIAIGTLLGGLILLDEDIHHFEIIDTRKGIQNEKIHFLFEDKDHLLWLALENGITSIEVNSSFRYFNEKNGLKGKVESVAEFMNRLYFATTLGLFYKNPGEAELKPLPSVGPECWKIVEFTSTDGKDHLLLGNKEGLFTIQDEKAVKIFDEDDAVYNILPSKKYPGIVYLGLGSGVAIMEYVSGNWIKRGYIEGLEDEIRHLNEDADGHLWCSKNELYCITPSIKNTLGLRFVKYSVQTVKFPVPETESEIILSRGNGQVFVFADYHTLLAGVDKGGIAFTRSSNFFGKEFSVSNRRQIVTCDYIGGRYWLEVIKQSQVNGRLKEYPEHGFFDCADGKLSAFRSYPFRIFPSEYEVKQFLYNDAGDIWIVGNFGAVVYNKQIVKIQFPEKFSGLIRRIVSNGREIFSGNFFVEKYHQYLAETVRVPSEVQPASTYPELTYDNNNLIFKLGSNYFISEDYNQYRYMLEGNDNGWTDFSNRREAIYTNLSEGTYTFKVQCKNIYNNFSKIESFHFAIKPPWYRTWWAYLLYSVLGLFSVVQIVILYTKNLNRVIHNQTSELRKQKSQIENKNKEITDSIFYARRIQDAIMPSREFIQRAFQQSFIFFKPKDIVSGDFYWATQRDDFRMIAAVDCTGHGVPGAFMSLLGNENLNEIVNEKDITRPDAVLTQLRDNIIRDLKQNEAGSDSKDGMDIALLRWNPSTYMLDFAGANNPLYIIRASNAEPLSGHRPILTAYGYDLYEIKGNKFPVGVFLTKDLPPFTLHTLTLIPGDALYIFSDGYADQFGGLEGKKFKYNQLKNVLLGLQSEPMNRQVQKLEEILEKWQGDLEQIDDVLVIGIRV